MSKFTKEQEEQILAVVRDLRDDHLSVTAMQVLRKYTTEENLGVLSGLNRQVSETEEEMFEAILAYRDFLPSSMDEELHHASKVREKIAAWEKQKLAEIEFFKMIAEMVGIFEKPTNWDNLPKALCAQCGEPFKSKRSTAKYCSTRCRVAAHRAG